MISMTKMLLGLALATTTLSACNKDDDACATLTKKICGDGSLSCDKVKPWLDSQMTGPNGEALSSSDKGQACTMILKEKDALVGFTEAAKAALPGKQ